VLEHDEGGQPIQVSFCAAVRSSRSDKHLLSTAGCLRSEPAAFYHLSLLCNYQLACYTKVSGMYRNFVQNERHAIT
jgi:hypothetical protein